MAACDVIVQVEGKPYTLALPIGALEEVATVNPYPYELWQAFMINRYSVAELTAVLTAALKWGDNGDVDAKAIIDTVGLDQAARFCEHALAAAIRDDSPPKSDAPETASDLNSAFDRTS